MRVRGRAVTCVAASVLALSACDDADLAGGDDDRTARMQLRRVGEFFYDEGAHGFLEVEHEDGSMRLTGEFDDADVAEGMSAAPPLEPGTYEVRSWMRPCLASCPDDGGSLDPPTAECSGEVTLSDGEVTHVVIEHEHDEDGDRCTVRVED